MLETLINDSHEDVIMVIAQNLSSIFKAILSAPFIIDDVKGNWLISNL